MAQLSGLIQPFQAQSGGSGWQEDSLLGLRGRLERKAWELSRESTAENCQQPPVRRQGRSWGELRKGRGVPTPEIVPHVAPLSQIPSQTQTWLPRHPSAKEAELGLKLPLRGRGSPVKVT